MLKVLQRMLKKPALSAKTGNDGELAARRFLEKKGLKTLDCNWRDGHREIDIVAKDGECLVFVEVKTRSETALVNGYFCAMSAKKRNAVRNCANAYMRNMAEKPWNWRFDVVEARHDASGKIVGISHFENVPY